MDLASQLLAASVLELFPQSTLLGGAHDGLKFSYDFQFPFTFQPEFLPRIEEKMRQLAKEQDQVQIFEMVPAVAAAFLQHHQQPGRAAAALEHGEDLATLVQLGAYTDYSPYPVEAGPFYFKLDPDLHRIDNVIRISGVSLKSKEQLKKFLKSDDPLTLGKSLNLFVQDSSGALLWLPRGEILRQTLIAWWKEEHAAQGFEFVKTQRGEHRALLERAPQLMRIAEMDGESDLATLRGSEAEIISSLQFFVKILTIFRFKHRLVGRREVRIQDRFEREWVGPSLELLEGGLIARRVFGSLERWILHLLDACEGNLPFWLAPEQVRICPLKQDPEPLKASLSARGFRVRVEGSEKKLGEKIHDALRERVPYIIVLGEKEQKLKKVSVRAYGAHTEALMDQEQLIEKLIEARNQRL